MPTSHTLNMLSIFLFLHPPLPLHPCLLTPPLPMVYMYSIHSAYLSLSWFPIHKNGCGWDKSLLYSSPIWRNSLKGTDRRVLKFKWLTRYHHHHGDMMVKDKSNYYYVILERKKLTEADLYKNKSDFVQILLEPLLPSFPCCYWPPRAFKSHSTNLTHPLFFLAFFPTFNMHTHAISSHLL